MRKSILVVLGILIIIGIVIGIRSFKFQYEKYKVSHTARVISNGKIYIVEHQWYRGKWSMFKMCSEKEEAIEIKNQINKEYLNGWERENVCGDWYIVK